MKKRLTQVRLAGAVIFAIGSTLCMPPHVASADTATWTNGGGDQLWSTTSNWFGALPAGNDVVFNNTGSVTNPSTPTSLLDSSLMNINSLTFNDSSGNDQFTSFVNSGSNLNIGGGVNVTSGGTAIFGGALANITTSSVTIFNGDITLNSDATLNVSQSMTIGRTGTPGTYNNGALIMAPGASLNIGTAAQPANLIIAETDLTGSGNQGCTAVFAPDSSQNPNMSLYLSNLNIATSYVATGTVDLTKYTGPLSIGNLNVGSNSGEYGNFMYGNGSQQNANISNINVINASLGFNGASTLNVAGGMTIGGRYGAGTLSLMSGAVLNVGTLANPATFTVDGGDTISVGVGSRLRVIGTLNDNGGTLNVRGSLSVSGNFNDNGGFVTDPTAVEFGNLIVDSGGYIGASRGDTYIVDGNFTDNSTPGNLGTSAMTLEFSGSGVHQLSSGNALSFGTLELSAGASLNVAASGPVNCGEIVLPDENPADVGSEITSNVPILYNPIDPANDYLLRDSYGLPGGGTLSPGAATAAWGAAVGGSWGTGSNWLPGVVPVSSIMAAFNTGSATPYEVTLGGNTSAAGMNVQGDNVTIQKAGFNLTVPGAVTVGGFSWQRSSLALAGGGVSTFGSLNINSFGQLDVTDNTVIINYGVGNPSSVGSIGGYIKSGYNGGAWNGAGIVSSTVASVNAALGNSHAYAIGYADASDIAVVTDGFTPGTVIIEPALVGDANLDGVVNYTDFQLLAANFNGVGTSWDEGDFNYGSGTTYTDFQLLAANFNDSTSLDNAEFDAMNAIALGHGETLVGNPDGDGFSLVNVPEPASVGMLGIVAVGLLTRRRRRAQRGRRRRVK